MNADIGPVAATYRADQLPELLRRCGRGPAVVFDLETNGISSRYSVVSCAAIKFDIDPAGGFLTERERFLRFYFPQEPPNPHAERVHGLTLEEIARRRAGAAYSRYFVDDQEFPAFCEGVPLFVAHNIDFDASFIPFLRFRDRFCTMKSNTRSKWPKLHEAARRYGLAPDPGRLHDSLYDAELAAGIFQRMLAQAGTSY